MAFRPTGLSLFGGSILKGVETSYTNKKIFVNNRNVLLVLFLHMGKMKIAFAFPREVVFESV